MPNFLLGTVLIYSYQSQLGRSRGLLHVGYINIMNIAHKVWPCFHANNLDVGWYERKTNDRKFYLLTSKSDLIVSFTSSEVKAWLNPMVLRQPASLARWSFDLGTPRRSRSSCPSFQTWRVNRVADRPVPLPPRPLPLPLVPDCPDTPDRVLAN